MQNYGNFWRYHSFHQVYLGLNTIKGQEIEFEAIGEIANKMLVYLDGLNKQVAENVLDWLRIELEKSYIVDLSLSKPNAFLKEG